MDETEFTEFTLPIKVNSKLSLNSIYGGLHWTIRMRQAQKIHEIVRFSMQSQEVARKFFETPVDITFKWCSKLDLDNHGYIAKLIIDSLKGYLLHDDNREYIHSITHEYHEKEGVLVRIRETENEVCQLKRKSGMYLNSSNKSK